MKEQSISHLPEGLVFAGVAPVKAKKFG
jgi:ABC-type iron transport system FetAB permease component